MKKMKNYFYLIIIIFINISCDPSCQKLIVVNKTNELIYYRLLTDTVLKQEYYLYSIFPNDSTKPNFVKGFCREGLWEYAINNESNDSTLHIFVFKINKLNNIIIRNHNYKRLDFRVKDLDSLKWRVEIKN